MAAQRKPTLPTNNNLSVDIVLVGVIGVYSWIFLQDFPLRLGGSWNNDNPILYAYSFKHPELFNELYVGPCLLRIWRPIAVVSSMQNWIPTCLYTYFNIDPHPVTLVITCIQGAGIGVGVYVLANVITRNRVVGLIATIYCYMAYPWGLNLANYGFNSEWTFFPYAAYGAIGAVLISFAFVVTAKHWFWSYPVLLYAGLMHPMMGFYAAAIIGVHYLRLLMLREISVWRLALLALTVAVFVTPGMVVSSSVDGTSVAKDELLSGLLVNPHHNPWNGHDRVHYAWLALVWWMLLAFLAWKRRERYSERYWQLWQAAVVATVLFSCSHQVGIKFGIPFFLGIIGLRSTTLLALLSIPLVIDYLVENLQSGDVIRVLNSVLLFTLPFLGAEYALVGYLTISFVMLDLSTGWFGPFQVSISGTWRTISRRASEIALVGWMISFVWISTLQIPQPGLLFRINSALTWRGYHSNPELNLRLQLLIVAIVICAVAKLFPRLMDALNKLFLKNPTVESSFVSSSPSHRRGMLWMMTVAYSACLLGFAWQTRIALHDSKKPAILDLQRWARHHSPANSLFLTTFRCGWVSGSMRRNMHTLSSEPYSYKGFHEVKQRRDRLLAFYNIPQDFAALHRGHKINSLQKQLLSRFEEADYIRFAEEFGVTHLVTRISILSLRAKLPVLYHNDRFIVFDLTRGVVERSL